VTPYSGRAATQELLRARSVLPMSPEEALTIIRRALDSFGLTEWRVRLTDFPPNPDGSRRLGLCRYQGKTIELSGSHVEQDRRDFVIETIAEEVAHCLVPDDLKHGSRWKNAYENIKSMIVADIEEQEVIERLIGAIH
jgi:SprT-like family